MAGGAASGRVEPEHERSTLNVTAMLALRIVAMYGRSPRAIWWFVILFIVISFESCLRGDAHQAVTRE
jgi:ABC-type transport system involved in cytochrome c biogenesis permease subunit